MLKILFVDGTKGFSPTRLAEKPTGGILTSLTLVPRCLAKEGHDVYVKSTWNNSAIVDGVHYLGIKDEVGDLDIVVFNRNVLNNDLVNQALATGANLVWWLHDIVDHRYLVDDAFRRIPNIVSLSGYCTRTYSEFYDIPRGRFTIIPNGVNQKVFYPGDYSRRNPNLFVFASAPIKGMKPLGYTFENLKRQFPKAELRVYSSQGLHELQDDAIVAHWMKELEKVGAQVLPPIPQEELADVFREAWMLLMPNSYPEICSNLLLQARACGLPVITSPVGSIPEFVDGNPITKSNPCDLYFWWVEFCKLSVSLAKDQERHKEISRKCPDGVKTWNDIGYLWHRYLTEIRSARTAFMNREVPA